MDAIEFSVFPGRHRLFTAESAASLVGQWTKLGEHRVKVLSASLDEDGSIRVQVAGEGIASVVPSDADVRGLTAG